MRPWSRVLLLLLVLLPALAGGLPVNGPLTFVGGLNHGTSAGGTDSYAITLSPVPTGFAYVSGTLYTFTADVANTDEATLNINGLGAVPIVKVRGGVSTALLTGDIRAGQVVQVTYDGTSMQCGNCLGNELAVLTLTEAAALALTQCTPGQEYRVTDAVTPHDRIKICNPQGDALENVVPTGGSPTLPGVATDTASIKGIKYTVQTSTSNVLLGVICQQDADTTAGGMTYTLPLLAEATCGEYKITIKAGTALVTVNTSGGETFRTVSGTPTTITFGGAPGHFAVIALRTTYWHPAMTAVPQPPASIYSTADCAPTEDASICFDSTRDTLKSGGSSIAGSLPRLLSVTRPAETVTNSTTSDQDLTSVFTIPASYLISAREIVAVFDVTVVTDGAASAIKFYLKLGANKCYDENASATPANSANYALRIVYSIIGTGAAGAAVNVECAHTDVGVPGAASYRNSIATTTHATNGTLNIVPGITYGTSTGGESFTLRQATIWGIN